MEDGKYVDGSIWFYAPNKGAPVFFAVAFACSTACHIWQCIHYKSWKLTGFYVFCGAIFTAGYIVRELGAFDYTDLIKYIVSVCLVYAAPPIMELANYQVLGRILYYVPQHSPIHPGRVLTSFLAISAVVEALNGNGAAYSANASLPPDKQDMGRALLKAALLLQVVVVGLFVLLAAVFQRRTARAGIRNANLSAALATLYASTALLTARTIYRVVEYFSLAAIHPEDPDIDPATFSPIVRYEWFFYVFEAALMLANTALVNARHPRRYLPPTTRVYLARDGVTEIEGPGYKDKRNFLLTIVDPFDLVGLFRGRDKETRFWEDQEEQEQGPGQQGKKEARRNKGGPEASA